MRTLVSGKYPTLSRRASLVLYALVISCFLLLAARTEINSSRIDRQQRAITLSQWQACIGGRAIIEQFNGQQRELAELDRKLTVKIAPEVAKRRIAIYEAGLPVQECGPEPR